MRRVGSVRYWLLPGSVPEAALAGDGARLCDGALPRSSAGASVNGFDVERSDAGGALVSLSGDTAGAAWVDGSVCSTGFAGSGGTLGR